jgi:hypothetical protein
VFGSQQNDGTSDGLPALHHFTTELGTSVANPSYNTTRFLQSELSFGNASYRLELLGGFETKRPPQQLHIHASMGIDIVAVDRMLLHLVHDKTVIFFKPIPKFLLNLDFWSTKLQCPRSCACDSTAQRFVPTGTDIDPCLHKQRKIALGFLYTYACLISSELDLAIADDKRLLPRNSDGSSIGWEAWRKFARELHQTHDPDKIHPRFLAAEMGYSHHVYGDHRNADLRIIFRNYKRRVIDKIVVVMATLAVFVGLGLTAMQVGLATKAIQKDEYFQFMSTWSAYLVACFSLCLSVVGSLVYLIWWAIRTFRRYLVPSVLWMMDHDPY